MKKDIKILVKKYACEIHWICNLVLKTTMTTMQTTTLTSDFYLHDYAGGDIYQSVFIL